MQMQMSMSLRQTLRQTMSLVITMPQVNWNMVQAFRNSGGGFPPYITPTFEEEQFTPRLKLVRNRIADFDSLDHETRMRLVDQANQVFRFAYTRGQDQDGKEKYYYKIPLIRNRNVYPEDIKKRISKKHFERAMAIIRAVGEMERIARAVPYYGLYQAVTKHLKKVYGVGLDDIVLVSVDRGGRIPCIILMRALGLSEMQSLKVDQGRRRIDRDRVEEFIAKGTLRGKHVLFVDSTVDSGRQIVALKQVFDDTALSAQLGFSSWSIVGSNEYGQNLDRHLNINWGVDPDSTFEDRPEMMGIDYAPGTHTKVIECPSETSEAIRKCLLAVPDGYIYSADNIDQQIEEQFVEWKKHQKQRRTEHQTTVQNGNLKHRQEVQAYRREQQVQRAQAKFDRKVDRIISTKRWQKMVTGHNALPAENLPLTLPNGTRHVHQNVLIVGSGKQDLPEVSAQFVADNLGPHCSFFAGTPKGNPGAVLQAIVNSSAVATPEVRLYQPEYMREQRDPLFNGVPITFVGPEKHHMRLQMVTDSQVILALGGGKGTLREVLIALGAGRSTIVIRGYGPVASYVIGTKRLREHRSLTVCSSLEEAVQTILDLSKI